MHTKPLIDFVISEGRFISRLSNTGLSDYQFIDNEKGHSLIFYEPFRAKREVQLLVIQWTSVVENFQVPR